MATKIVTKNSSTASAVPTASDLVQGELAVNVADKRLFTEDNAGAIVELGTNPSSLTVSGNIDVDGVTNLDAVDIDGAVDMASTLQVDGAATFTTEITANGGIALGDNDKATFGAGDDLQIFHNGTDSLIREVGTGGLKIDTNGPDITLRVNATESAIVANSNGSVDLYYDNAKKLATTTTGIDVTGTATMDGLTVVGSGSKIRYDVASSNPHTNPTLHLENQNTTDGNVASLMLSADNANGVSGSAYIYAQSETSNQKGNLVFAREDGANNPVTSMKLSSNGDISFYEDTGTTAKLFWDASAESLGIGCSPSTKLHVQDSAGSPQIRIDNQGTASGIASLLFRSGGAGNPSSIIQSGGTSSGNQGIVFKHGDFGSEAERMRIDSSGNLLVGTTDTSPHTNNTGTVDDNGIALSNAGRLSMARKGATVALLNRTDNDGEILNFRKDGTTVGSISVTGSATSYNTSSDQRLKENIADADDAGSKIDAIQVRKYDWKADGSHQDYGMIAQELLEVVPEAVSVPEDSEEMMGVDYSKLVPMLIKEIQSLRNRVAQLEE